MILRRAEPLVAKYMQHPGKCLLLASVWFGLSSGLIEITIIAIQKFWRKELLLLGSHFVWMVPVVAVAYLVFFGLALLLMARLLPRLTLFRVSIFILAFLSLLSPLFRIPRLHFYATLLLAAGLAAQAARFIMAHQDFFFTLVRSTLKWMVALAICLGVTVSGGQMIFERDAVAKLPPAPPGAPNVLLIVLDTVRAESLSLYGYPKPTTPNLERFAKDGVVFDRALSTSPWTLPSHATMFTGRWPHELSADWKTPLDSTYPTLAESLKAHGYVTAGFVANLIYGSSVHGLDRGFIHYRDFPVSAGQMFLSSSLGALIGNDNRLRYWLNYHRVLNRKTAGEVNEDFLSWLSGKDQRPFFAFLNYMDAHEPYLPPQPFNGKFGPKREETKFWHTSIDAFRPAKWKMSQKEVQIEVAAYEGAIAYIDHQLGLLMDELERRGLLRNTLVIITSDHGEQFGEHRLFSHGNSLYRQLLHVPLMIYFRNHIPAGKIIREPVTLRDIPATVIDLIGVEDRASFPGRSLSRHWQEPKKKRGSENGILISEATRRVFGVHPWYPLSKGEMLSMVGGGYHYIRNGDNREELYDFDNDPAEERDMVRTAGGQAIMRRFRESIKIMLQGDQGQKQSAASDRLNGVTVK